MTHQHVLHLWCPPFPPLIFASTATTSEMVQAVLLADTAIRSTVRVSAAGVDAEIDCYMQEACDMNHDNSLLFWQDHELSYPLLAPFAEDFVSASTSQTYVENVFSACGVTSVLRSTTELMQAYKIVFFSENKREVSVNNLANGKCDCN